MAAIDPTPPRARAAPRAILIAGPLLAPLTPLTSLALLAALLAHGPAAADERAPEAVRLFDRADVNADRELDAQEIRRARALRFEELDRDGDRRLTADDFRDQPRGGRRFRALRRLDRDGDGRITGNEYLKRGDRLPGDRNRDGAVSVEEFFDGGYRALRRSGG